MPNLAVLYRLKALFRRGTLEMARGTKVPPGTVLRWKNGSIRLAEKAMLRRGVILDAQSGSIDIGRNVSINDYSILLGHGGITIGDDVRIAGQVMIASFDHDFEDAGTLIRQQGIIKKPIVIEDDVWIGAGAKILGGAHIARGCVIGANAVVKGRTQPYGVYVGVPAKRIKQRSGPAASDRTAA